MTTPNIDVLMPVTYTGTIPAASGNCYFTIDGKKEPRPIVPFTGLVMVQVVSGSKSPVQGYAHEGGYTYANMGKATGSKYNWRCTYNVVVDKGQQVQAYPYIGTSDSDPANVGAPVSITFLPMGEHKN